MLKQIKTLGIALVIGSMITGCTYNNVEAATMTTAKPKIEKQVKKENKNTMEERVKDMANAYIARYGKGNFANHIDAFDKFMSKEWNNIEALAIKDAKRFNKEEKNSKEYPIVSQLNEYGEYQTNFKELNKKYKINKLTLEEKDALRFMYKYFFMENVDAKACMEKCKYCKKQFVLDKHQVILNGQPHCGCKSELKLKKLTKKEVIEAMTTDPFYKNKYDGITKQTKNTITVKLTNDKKMQFNLNTRIVKYVK